MRFIEIINPSGHSDFINSRAIVGVTVRDRPPRVEVYVVGGGVFRQEYTDLSSAAIGQMEILDELGVMGG